MAAAFYGRGRDRPLSRTGLLILEADRTGTCLSEGRAPPLRPGCGPGNGAGRSKSIPVTPPLRGRSLGLAVRVGPCDALCSPSRSLCRPCSGGAPWDLQSSSAAAAAIAAAVCGPLLPRKNRLSRTDAPARGRCRRCCRARRPSCAYWHCKRRLERLLFVSLSPPRGPKAVVIYFNSFDFWFETSSLQLQPPPSRLQLDCKSAGRDATTEAASGLVQDAAWSASATHVFPYLPFLLLY